jgi:zinc transport system permease protein
MRYRMVMDILTYGFFQKALMIAVLASVAAGIMGTYIVIRRISLITGSIAHSAFGGLGLSLFMGFNPLLGATGFSIISAALIAFFRKKSNYRLDTLLSFLWSTGMALGLVFIFMTPGYATDLNSFLFGNILLVSNFDLIFIIVLNLAIIATVLLLYNPFLAVSFDEEYASTRNLPVSLIYLVLLSLIALTIVAVIKVVGIVLMIALLTIPAASAQMFSRTVKEIMLASILISLFSMLAGLFLSVAMDFPPGPIIVLITSGIYLASMLLSKLKR